MRLDLLKLRISLSTHRPTDLLAAGMLLASSCTSSETTPQRSISPSETSPTAPASATSSTYKSLPKDSASIAYEDIQTDTIPFSTQPSFAADYAILHQDTLLVIANSLNVMYPFGQVSHASDIRRKYPQFNLTRGVEQPNGIVTAYTVLRYKHSAVKFYDNALDGALVVAGHIVDSDLLLQNAVHPGMSLGQVLSAFFTDINQARLQQLQVLRIESSVAEIKYFYNFEHAKLKDIKLDSYSVLSKKL